MRALLFALFLAAPLWADGPNPGGSLAALAGLRQALSAGGSSLASLGDKEFAATPLTKSDAAKACELLWAAHVAEMKTQRAAEVDNRKITDGPLTMPFWYTTFGENPAGGHSLWISMHGGGNAPPRVNDRQWENQKRLYRLDEGIYVAPRAPTNTWNLWHEPHIDRFFARLIEDMVALEGVNPDRVYLMGYSAGGDGVYQLAPRMADRWAAAAMMAGHPNDASPLGLRNVAFALQVGGKDSAYNRNKIVAEWAHKLDDLRHDDPGGYEHFVKIYENKSHWMDREDAVALPWLAKHTRNPIPDRVVWQQASVTHDWYYWLAVPKGTAKAKSLVIATRAGQTIDIAKADGVSQLHIYLDDRMVDLDKPVKVTFNGHVLFEGKADRTAGTMMRTLVARGDPQLIFAAMIPVTLPNAGD